MLGAFARMFSQRQVCEVHQEDEGAVLVAARGTGEPGTAENVTDVAPEAFVEKVDDEGGTVYYVPFLDTLRKALKGDGK